MEELQDLIKFLKNKGLEHHKINIDLLCGIIEYLENKQENKQCNIADVSQCNEQLMAMLTSRVLKIQSEPDGIVRETMINNLLIDINCS